VKSLAIALVLALSVAFAPTAWADADADFVNALERAGFVFDGGGRANSVQLGHWVCDSLDSGASPGALRYSLQESSTRLSGTEGPDVIVRLAVQYLCPQHTDKLG
jgi:Protein of unknown function (DUF732)